MKNRPDVKLAALQEQLAGANQTAARAAFLPQVAAQAGWEFNGGAWNTRASSWVVGAVARINVFHGFADTARLAEAREQAARRALERQQAETAAGWTCTSPPPGSTRPGPAKPSAARPWIRPGESRRIRGRP